MDYSAVLAAMMLATGFVALIWVVRWDPQGPAPDRDRRLRESGCDVADPNDAEGSAPYDSRDCGRPSSD